MLRSYITLTKYPLDILRVLRLLFKVLDLALEVEGYLLDVFLSLFLEFLEFAVVLGCHVVVVAGFHRQLRFQLMYLPSVEILQPRQLIPKSLVLHYHILVLVEQVIDFKLKLGDGDILSTELLLQLDELVLKLDPELALVVQIVLELVLGLLELLPLIFQHIFDFPEVVVLVGPHTIYALPNHVHRCEYPLFLETEL